MLDIALILALALLAIAFIVWIRTLPDSTATPPKKSDSFCSSNC
jgi:hypothetical protein